MVIILLLLRSRSSEDHMTICVACLLRGNLGHGHRLLLSQHCRRFFSEKCFQSAVFVVTMVTRRVRGFLAEEVRCVQERWGPVLWSSCGSWDRTPPPQSPYPAPPTPVPPPYPPAHPYPSASSKPTRIAQPRLSRVRGRSSPARGYKFGCVCS